MRECVDDTGIGCCDSNCRRNPFWLRDRFERPTPTFSDAWIQLFRLRRAFVVIIAPIRCNPVDRLGHCGRIFRRAESHVFSGALCLIRARRLQLLGKRLNVRLQRAHIPDHGDAEVHYSTSSRSNTCQIECECGPRNACTVCVLVASTAFVSGSSRLTTTRSRARTSSHSLVRNSNRVGAAGLLPDVPVPETMRGITYNPHFRFAYVGVVGHLPDVPDIRYRSYSSGISGSTVCDIH